MLLPTLFDTFVSLLLNTEASAMRNIVCTVEHMRAEPASALSSSRNSPLPPANICAASPSPAGTASDGRQSRSTGAPRSLHRKLLSPDRRKKEPEALRVAAEEKQMRAERSRAQLEAERLAKLEKVCARNVHPDHLVSCADPLASLQQWCQLLVAHCTRNTRMKEDTERMLSRSANVCSLHIDVELAWLHASSQCQ
jgi:hypothetical protein